MLHNNVLNTEILHLYIDVTDILLLYNQLVSFSYFNEHLIHGKLSVDATKDIIEQGYNIFDATKYKMWDTESHTKEVKLK